MRTLRPVSAVALPYARHAAPGKAEGRAAAALTDAEVSRRVERRLAVLPPAARAVAAAAALALRWLAPLILLGRWRRFERLEPAAREELLLRLQADGRPWVRGPFLALRSVLLPACYPEEP